jgi:hypothetical protein
MSAWAIALTLAAGYLVNKNLKMTHRLDQSVKEYQTARPANPGPATEEIRQVQRAVPIADSLQDLNLQDLTRDDVKHLSQERARAAQEVVAYESPTVPEIQGVYLHFDRHGI